MHAVNNRDVEKLLFLAVVAKVVAGTVTGVTMGGAQPPGAHRLMFTGIQ